MTQLQTPSVTVDFDKMWIPVGERPSSGLQPADWAWLGLIGAGLIFEFSSKDLLSDSSARACNRNPFLARFVILALAGHLAVVIPDKIDLFNAKNLVHRGIVRCYRHIRA